MSTMKLSYQRWADARRARRRSWADAFDDPVLLCTCADGAPCH